ncbi:hypothetical protein MNBD_DELTA01-1968 [hydrothermal vent metagenome]|uniref:Methyltransferase FkbM domain-containing protein n=1 Tax=hydrothermal vent metagenome TaxID=652676 RepID=A0A3B0QZT0_9ZZZZ
MLNTKMTAFNLFVKIVRWQEALSSKCALLFSALGVQRIFFISRLTLLARGFINYVIFSLFNKLKPDETVTADIHGNKMLINPKDRGIAPSLLLYGVMEKSETKLFKKLIDRGMIVVDVGANIGYYSLIASSIVGKDGAVYAFEPEELTHKLLCDNIKLNSRNNIFPVQKALSNTSGKIQLWVDYAGNAISSFAKNNVLAFSTSPINNMAEEPRPLTVEKTTLDEFFSKTSYKVDFIKIDTQGAEGLVLAGAEKILKRNKYLKIIMEFWPEGLKKLGTDPLELLLKLQDYGFTIKLINETKQSVEAINPTVFYKQIEAMTGHQEFNLFLEK